MRKPLASPPSHPRRGISIYNVFTYVFLFFTIYFLIEAISYLRPEGQSSQQAAEDILESWGLEKPESFNPK